MEYHIVLSFKYHWQEKQIYYKHLTFQKITNNKDKNKYEKFENYKKTPTFFSIMR